MGAVFDVVTTHQFRNERRQFLGIGLFAALDGSLAGNGMEQIVMDRGRIQTFSIQKILGQLRQASLCVLFINVCGNCPQDQSSTAEILYGKPQLLETSAFSSKIAVSSLPNDV